MVCHRLGGWFDRHTLSLPRSRHGATAAGANNEPACGSGHGPDASGPGSGSSGPNACVPGTGGSGRSGPNACGPDTGGSGRSGPGASSPGGSSPNRGGRGGSDSVRPGASSGPNAGSHCAGRARGARPLLCQLDRRHGRSGLDPESAPSHR